MEHLQGCDQPSVLLTHPRSLWSGWVLHTRKIPPCHSSSKHSILPTTSPVAYKPHPVGFLRAGTHPCQGCRMTHTAFDVITCPCSPACAGAQEPYGPCPLAAFTKHRARTLGLVDQQLMYSSVVLWVSPPPNFYVVPPSKRPPVRVPLPVCPIQIQGQFSKFPIQKVAHFFY